MGKKILTCCPNPPLLLSRAVFCLLVGVLPTARLLADRATAVNEIRNGNTDYFAGDYAAAEVHFSTAVTNDPTWALSFNNRGLARFHQGDFGGADADFDQAKLISSNTYASAFVNKGKSLAAQRRFADAAAELQAGLAVASNSASLYYNLGWVYGEQGAFAGAVSNYTVALSLNAEHHKARLARGIAYAKQGVASNAVDDFYYVINHADDGDMLATLAAYNLQVLRGPGIDFDSNPAAAGYTAGVFLWSAQQYEAALAVLATARSNETDVAEIPWMSYWSHLASRRTAEAADALDTARALMATVRVTSVSFPATVYIDGTKRGTTPADLHLFPSAFDLTLRGEVGGDALEWRGVAYTDGTSGGTNDIRLRPGAVTAYSVFGPIADSDRDWLADAWETRWFSGLGQGPGDDPDADGEINLYEHWWQGNPGEKDSRRLVMLQPLGGEVYMDPSSAVTCLWSRVGAGWLETDTLRVDYSADAGATWSTISGAAFVQATNDLYAWTISGLEPNFSYRLRVRCNQDVQASAASGTFRIGTGAALYVNDGSTANDEWCTAAGDDANTGTDPAHPKATVQAILAAYALEPGDTVRIDTGTYTLTNNIVVSSADEGSSALPVVFEASPYGVTFDRNSTASGSYGWHVAAGADYVRLRTAAGTRHPGVAQRWMKVTGAYHGICVEGTYCHLSRLDAADNLYGGIYINGQRGNLANCLMRGSANTANGCGLYVNSGAAYLSVSNCTMTGNAKYGVYFGSASSVSLRNNILTAAGAGTYAIYRASASYTPDSDFNDLYASAGACVGYTGSDAMTLLDWQNATGVDKSSVAVDPLFVDAAGGDYHPRSTAGSYHAGAWTSDGASSATIDAGIGSVALETTPNATPSAPVERGRRNLGAYGGTEQASRTPDERLTLRLDAPVGGEVYSDQSAPVAVTWRWTGGGWRASDTLRLEYSADSGGTWQSVPGAGGLSVTNGAYGWDVSGLTPGARYRARIVCVQQGTMTDHSPEDFRVGRFLRFYVNDGETTNDAWCDARGSDANTGTDPAHPKATVQAIVATYDLEPGDEVRIDTGTYILQSNIAVTGADQGALSNAVTFAASPYGVTFDRNSTASGAYGWHLSNCRYVTLTTASSTKYPGVPQRWMRVTGGYHGVALFTADDCELHRIEATGNAAFGMYVYDSDRASVRNNVVHHNGDDGVFMEYSDYGTLENNTLAHNADDQLYIGYSASPVTLRNNIIVADGPGDYAINWYSTGYTLYSDFNCVYAVNGAYVAQVSGARPTLRDWQTASGKDANSLEAWPGFANDAGGDYHVQSFEGRYAGGTWVSDGFHGRTIDAGDPATAVTLEAPPNGGRVNLGAYGNTEQASLSARDTVHWLDVASVVAAVTPTVGTHAYYEDARVAARADVAVDYVGAQATQYVFAGWALTGVANTAGVSSGAANTVVFDMTNDALLAWQWRTNYWLELATTGSGGVTATSGWYAVGTTVAVAAVAGTYWQHREWTGDTAGSVATGTTLRVTMDRPRAITAVFEPRPEYDVDRFAWSAIGATQSVGRPIPVTITAVSTSGAPALAFGGTVRFGHAGGTIYDGAAHTSASSASYSYGVRLAFSNDVTVTHVRHYWGNTVSIWADDGTLLVSRPVTSVPGKWVETPLDAPLHLSAGGIYRIGVYGGYTTIYYSTAACPFTFADGTVLSGCYDSSYPYDGFPAATTTGARYFAGLRYVVGHASATDVLPLESGAFVNGVWTGDVTALDVASNVVLRAMDDEGHRGDSGPFDTVADGSVTLTLPVAVVEGGAVQGRVSVDPPPVGNLTVNLQSFDTTELTVPAFVTVPSGASSATFDVTAVDDAELDRAQVVRVRAWGAGYAEGTAEVRVEDNDTTALAVSLPDELTEGNGTQSGAKVSVPVAPTVDVDIALTSDDTTELTVPATVTLPAGSTSVAFNVSVVNDGEIDFDQTVVVTARVNGWTDGTDSIVIHDNEHTNLLVTLPSQIYENAGTQVNAGRVSLSGTLPYDLIVALLSDDTTELTVPSTVTVAAGSTYRSFDLEPRDEALHDGARSVHVSAYAAGFNAGSNAVRIADDELHYLEMGAVSAVQTAAVPFSVSVTARDVDGAAITVFTNPLRLRVEDPGLGLRVEPTNLTGLVNGAWNGSVTVHGLGADAVLVADDGAGHSATSTPFNVVVGPLHHFDWAPIASPQQPNVPFDVSVTAKDRNGYTLSGFEDEAELIGKAGEALETYTMLKAPSHSRSGSGSYTVGNSFTPNADLIVTHLLHYFGTKVSIWTDNGQLVLQEPVKSTAGTWSETELASPVTLNGGTTYRIAAYTGGAGYYWRTDMDSPFEHGTMGQGYERSGDGFPTTPDSVRWWLVDFRYSIAPETTVPVSPVSIGPFANGAWTGAVTVLSQASNMYLRAVHATGRSGNSGRFNVGVVSLDVASVHGGAAPGVGRSYYSRDAQVTGSVTNSPVDMGTTQYVCTGWVGTGSVASRPSGGTDTGAMVLHEDSSLTWLWRTNFWLALDIATGSVDVADGWYARGSEVTVTATVPDGSRLSGWDGTTEGCRVEGDRLIVPMDRPRSLTARLARMFYVNDAATTYDAWCTAPGDDTNSGLQPSQPKATVPAVLEAYDLEPGDMVRIDTGTYVLTNGITVTSADEGSSAAPVVFEASPYGVTFDRGNTASGCYAWYLNNCDYVILRTAASTSCPGVAQRWARVRGGYHGLYLYYANFCSLIRMESASNSVHGVYGYESHRTVFSNCLVRANVNDGLVLARCDYNTVVNCTIADNDHDQLYVDYSTSPLTVRNCILAANGSGDNAVYLYSTGYLVDWDYNCLYATNGAYVGYAGRSLTTLAEWRAATAQDAHSTDAAPAFADPAGSDYHLAGTAGSYHGGAWTADAVSSPCIDAGYGDEGDEPAPSKTPGADGMLARRNLGAYGGTEQGTKTPNERRLVLNGPVGRELYSDQGTPVPISWNRFGAAWGTGDTLRLAYSADSGSSWSAIPGAGRLTATDSTYDWQVGDLAPGALYRVRLTCNQAPYVSDWSPGDFRIGRYLEFYVNDGSTVRDAWCSAPGSVANNGASPASPKADVQAILDTYDLEAGDVVRIDTGTYVLTNTIVVTSADEGSSAAPVTFEGSPYGVTINRDDAWVASSYVWYLNHCDYVTLRTAASTKYPGVAQRWMALTGGYAGLQLYYANQCTCEGVTIENNAGHGIYGNNSTYGTYRNNVVRLNGEDGVNLIGCSGCMLLNNTLVRNGDDQLVIDSGTSPLTLRNNIVYADGIGDFAVYWYSTGYSLDSDCNCLFATNGAAVGYAGGVRRNLADWRAATGKDASSLSLDPLFVNADTDCHPRSSAAAGTYVQASGTWTRFTGEISPCIDMGDTSSAYALEPQWNGGCVNIGAYGNTPFASRSPDTDGDGLCDNRERFVHGTDATRADSDGDGMRDPSELLAGTDPRNEHSVFAITELRGTPGTGTVVRWASVAGKLYRVDRSANPPAGFDTLRQNIIATPPENVFTDRDGPTNRAFYRIGVK